LFTIKKGLNDTPYLLNWRALKMATKKADLKNTKNIKKLCIYCGASLGTNVDYANAAKELGTLLAQNNIQVIYGGGKGGIMGVVANSVLQGGGEVLGVIPKFLLERELAHEGLTKLHIVPTMHARKHKMSELSDAFVILPGGLGTLEEVSEMITWRQLERHNKPIVFLNTNGYWKPFQQLIANIIDEGFGHGNAFNLYEMRNTPTDVLHFLLNHPNS
tara:strand:- start:2559 stop:3209 length:651 start_codon:yes stop_codon:yes gene_type:complete